MCPSLIEMHSYLDDVRIPLRLACKTKSDWPMVISLWFIHQDNLIYCATQRTARVVTYLKNDSRCAFEIAEDRPPYCGIRGQARARIDASLGGEILEMLILRYLGGTNNELATNLLAKIDSEVAIVIEPFRIYTWDFSERMMDVSKQYGAKKVCP